jgi:hypothetical protein
MRHCHRPVSQRVCIPCDHAPHQAMANFSVRHSKERWPAWPALANRTRDIHQSKHAAHRRQRNSHVQLRSRAGEVSKKSEMERPHKQLNSNMLWQRHPHDLPTVPQRHTGGASHCRHARKQSAVYAVGTHKMAWPVKPGTHARTTTVHVPPI